MKRFLVLPGGGAYGAYQVGAVEYLLNEQGLTFDGFLGCSVGALNAAFLAQANNHEFMIDLASDLRDLWLSIGGNRNVYNLSLPNLIKGKSIFNPAGLKRLIKQNINLVLLHSGKHLSIPVVNINTGEVGYKNGSDPNILDWILASASIPLAFPGVKFGGDLYFDGSLKDITPLGNLFDDPDNIPDEIVIISHRPLDKKYVSYPRNIWEIAGKVFGIVTSEMYYNDFVLLNERNNNPLFKHVKVKIIQPATSLKGGFMEFKPDWIAANIETGFESARKAYKVL